MEEPPLDKRDLLVTVRESGKIHGYLAIDTLVGGRAHGGVRMHPKVSAEELRILARTMSRKYEFLGLPLGGAKAGVVSDPEGPLEERREALAAFGRALEPVLEAELFVPAADMGTNLEDVRTMLEAAGVTYERRRMPPVPSGEYTAYSVLSCARAMAISRDRSLSGLRVAVQGFGEVGARLADLLDDSGASVVAISTSQGALYARSGLDVKSLRNLSQDLGSAVVQRDDLGERLEGDLIFSLEVDALFPCAQHHAITVANIADLRAWLLCPGANAPWPSGLEDHLIEREVLYLPDFVANSGGVLGTVLAYVGVGPEERAALVEEVFERNATWILGRAAQTGRPVREIADYLRGQRRVQPGANGRAVLDPVRWGLELHRRGLVPRWLVKMFAEPHLVGRATAGLSP